MAGIPESRYDLFESESFCHFATLLPDGFPHVTPVWVDHDGGDVLINTARGRRKERNIRQDPRGGFSVLDPDDPYRFCSGWGEVVEVTSEGAVEHIDELARRYMDVEEYPYKDQDEGERLIVRLRPEHVVTE